MADIFISYSRKDKDFVRRLDEALKSRGREAWVDWEDIRPTEEWMQAIYAAIEGADTFMPANFLDGFEMYELRQLDERLRVKFYERV